MKQIERAAIAMAGGQSAWTGMSDAIKDQYREDARRAAEVLVNAVPWDLIELAARTELTKHSGSLTVRRATPAVLDIIARSVVAAMKRSGYTVVYGPPSEGMSTPGPAKPGWE